MQSLHWQTCSRYCHRHLLIPHSFNRAFSARSSSASPGPAVIPWFIDPSDIRPPAPSPAPAPSPPSTPRPSLPHPKAPQAATAPLPPSLPPTGIIARLHAALLTSPHLEPGSLLVRDPVPTAIGPPLPDSAPRGRRKRGRTYAGEGVQDATGGIWSWVVLAQVKEGTEGRGAIESVVRIVRKTLLTAHESLPLPPNSKRQIGDGWAMIDAGDFAVHILSKEAREKYFPERRTW